MNKGHFSGILLISIFLLYPLLTKCSLSLLNCIPLDELSGEQFLYVSPNIQCWVGIHFYFFLFIGVFGILVWGISFPILVGFAIKKKNFLKGEINSIISLKTNESPIHQTSINSAGKKFNNMKSIENESKEIYAFFYRDYKLQFYFWESLIFIQKFLISLFQDIPKIIGEEKADLLFIFALLIYFSLLIQHKPFKIREMNVLEIYSKIL